MRGLFWGIGGVLALAALQSDAKIRHPYGVLEMDNLTLPLVLDGYRHVPRILKFDRATRTGPKAIAFLSFAESVAAAGSDMLVLSVAVEDGGDHTNLDLMRDFGFIKEYVKGLGVIEEEIINDEAMDRKFPAYLLFKRGVPGRPGKETRYWGAITHESLVQWARTEAAVGIPFEGTLVEMDELARLYNVAGGTLADRQAALARAKAVQANYTALDLHRAAQRYIDLMEAAMHPAETDDSLVFADGLAAFFGRQMRSCEKRLRKKAVGAAERADLLVMKRVLAAFG